MNTPFAIPDNPDSACQPPSTKDFLVDRTFRALARIGVVLVLALVFALVYEVGRKALPGIEKHGFDVLFGSVWDVNQGKYGILPAIWGTLYSALIALLIAGFFGVSMAIFLTQDFLPARLAAVFRTIVELLAAIPSVVYGLWGIYVVIPAIRPLTAWLNSELGWIPFFGTSLSGPGLLPAALVLAIMILPTIAAVSQDALTSVPMKTKQAAYGMGTTHWEAILKVMVPSAATGIFGSLVLGLGRALGNHGTGHAGGQRQHHFPVAVRPGQHPGCAVGAELPGGWPQRGGGADVRRPGADVHHPAGERARLDDHALRPAG